MHYNDSFSRCKKEHKKISIDELRHNVFFAIINLISVCLEKLEQVAEKNDKNDKDQKGEECVIIKENVFNNILENLKWAKEIAKKCEDDPTQFSRSDLQSIIDESELRLKTILL